MKKPVDFRINSRGYTIVELLVAAVILAVAFIGLFSLVRTSRQIDIGELHRRRARAVIDSVFELTEYSYTNYANLQSITGQTVEMKIGSGNVTVGSLDVTVGDPQQITTDDGTPIPFKEVTITVTWDEIEGQEEISITKKIAPLP